MRILPLLPLLLFSFPAAAEQPKLAMTALQCTPSDLCDGAGFRQRMDLQDRLEAQVLKVVRGHLGIVTPDAVMRELTMGGMSRSDAERTCIEANCAVDIGGALGAQYIMQSVILQVGGRYKLTVKVWHVEDNTAASSGWVYAETMAGLAAELPTLARKACAPLVTRSRRQASEVAAFDEGGDDGPQISAGSVTDALGGLVAAGSPASARVTVTGAGGESFTLRIGDTRDRLPLGSYRWSAKASGHWPVEGTVDVRPDQVTPVIVQLKKLGSLAVVGEPSGARVDIVGPSGALKPVGLGTTLRSLQPGAYQITVSKRGFEQQTIKDSVEPGGHKRVSVALLPLGSLTINGRPAGAMVTVRAKTLGFEHSGGLPWAARALKSGNYIIEVRRMGYASARQAAKVVAGKQTVVTIQLEPGSGWDQKSAEAGGQLVSRWGYTMVRIPAGTYSMGSNSGDRDEKPVHQVRLTRSFAVGKTEVTQAQYEALMGKNPSDYRGPNRPVEKVSWYDAVAFANAASKRDGLEPCYDFSGDDVRWPKGLDCTGYRLPTEAEWEAAGRGSKNHKYSGTGDIDRVAWYSGNSGSRTHDVGTKAPNAYGLYDMSGNVWEWVWDGYDEYASGAVDDPTGSSSPSYRVYRGGSWNGNAALARVANRGGNWPGSRDHYLGFRLSRTVP